jgi:cytochrome c peroxidase
MYKQYNNFGFYREIRYYFIFFVCLSAFLCCDEDAIPPDVPNPTTTPYVANLPSWLGSEIPSPKDNPMTVEGVALGKRLFYDTRLSDDNTMSCATCHVQKDGFSDARVFSVGINGKVGTRQAMPIFNLAWNESFFWDGRSPTLEAQAHDPVVNPIEMNTTWVKVLQKVQSDATYVSAFQKAFGTKIIDSTFVTKAIAQFERSIVSFNSKFDRFYYQQDSTAFNAMEKRGMDVFFKRADCGHCHEGILFSDNTMKNNGLDLVLTDLGQGEVTRNPSDNGKFKVSTLRNIAYTAPYMHDGRFATLEQVIDHYSDGVVRFSPNLDPSMLGLAHGIPLNEAEKRDLIAFLHTLSDPNVRNNVAWRF